MTEEQLKILRAIQKAVKHELGSAHTLSAIINSWNNPNSNLTDEDMLLMIESYNSDNNIN